MKSASCVHVRKFYRNNQVQDGMFLFLGRVCIILKSIGQPLHCVVIQYFTATCVTNVNILLTQRWNIYVIVIPWARVVCLIYTPEARGPQARGCIYQANHKCPWHN